MQQLIAAVELSCKKAVEEVGEDTVALGHRVEAMINGQGDIMQAVTAINECTIRRFEFPYEPS